MGRLIQQGKRDEGGGDHTTRQVGSDGLARERSTVTTRKKLMRWFSLALRVRNPGVRCFVGGVEHHQEDKAGEQACRCSLLVLINLYNAYLC